MLFIRSSRNLTHKYACQYLGLRSLSTTPNTPSPLDSVTDITVLTQLTPEQLQPIRKLLDENAALREQLRTAQALTRAQAKIAEKAGLVNELKQAHEAAVKGDVPKPQPKPNVLPPQVTEAVLKRNKNKDMLLITITTLLFLQGLISYKNERLVQKELVTTKERSEDNEKLLAAALDGLERINSLVAKEKTPDATKIVDSVKEKVRLYRLKETTNAQSS